MFHHPVQRINSPESRHACAVQFGVTYTYSLMLFYQRRVSECTTSSCTLSDHGVKGTAMTRVI